VRYSDDGRIEIDNNAALRTVALGRRNYLFADRTPAASARRPSTVLSDRRNLTDFILKRICEKY
jgi:hypothetical protein